MSLKLYGNGSIENLTSINASVSATELGYLDGVTGALLQNPGSWTSYTPVLTASTTNPSIGDGTVIGKYCQLGKIVFAHIRIFFGSSGVSAGTGTYYISLPVNCLQSNIGIGFADLADANTGARSIGFCKPADATKFMIDYDGGNYLGVQNASPWTWAATDGIWAVLTYEAA